MGSIRHIIAVMLLCPLAAMAQIGQYRNELAVGVNGGITLSTVSFTPEVPQDMLLGRTAGVTVRYTGEKYFNSICAVVAEVNYAQLGWKERIWDHNDQPVIGHEGQEEAYQRVINYVQVPFMARMGWGRERSGLQFFFQLGPQVGFLLSEKADYNFDLDNPNMTDRMAQVSGPGNSGMYHMPVENTLDYGITGGLGLELSNRHIGHVLIEGRYYFGLGNVYGNSKRDYFAKSNHQTIVVKASWLFDLMKSKNPKIK